MLSVAPAPAWHPDWLCSALSPGILDAEQPQTDPDQGGPQGKGAILTAMNDLEELDYWGQGYQWGPRQ